MGSPCGGYRSVAWVGLGLRVRANHSQIMFILVHWPDWLDIYEGQLQLDGLVISSGRLAQVGSPRPSPGRSRFEFGVRVKS